MKMRKYEDIKPSNRTNFVMVYYHAGRTLTQIETLLKKAYGNSLPVRPRDRLNHLQFKLEQMTARYKQSENEMKDRIYKFTRKENLYYTRYADDITISGNDVKIKKVISFISMVLKENNFELNQDKIKVMRKNSCQLVTGIVSNNSVLNAPKYKIKDLRKEIYYIRKYGLDDHMTHVGIKKAHYIEHLMGVANFILFINKNNKTAKEALNFLRELQKQINYTF